MASRYVVRKNEYYDSVFLMRIAKTIDDEPGVRQSAVVMATDANKQLLKDIGITGDTISLASPNDLVVAVIADEISTLERVLANLDTRLQSLTGPARPSSYRTIDEAIESNPETNLVVISVPGNYAAREAHRALTAGKHVFLFSNNVSLEEEVKLKQYAHSRGLLVMGPDCGTSLINGLGIGFANNVRRGPVGVVGPSGTGLQEFTSLVHLAGSGISHAIGTGSRDLTDAVGGITTLMAFDALDTDPMTKVIAIVSKPAQPETLKRLMERIKICSKPVVGCFLGLDRSLVGGDHFFQAETIDEAVLQSLTLIDPGRPVASPMPDMHHTAAQEVARWQPEQKYVRGLFAGGTFCYQSQKVFIKSGVSVYSNSPLDKRYHLERPGSSLEHSLIDMGDDYFTQGKPHPMIDATERRKRLLAEAADPEVAVLLLDFILGHIASPDPVGDLIESIREIKVAATRAGRHLSVVSSVCGTDLDLQNCLQQVSMLEQAGVLVFPSNMQAAQFCVHLLQAKR